MSRRRRGASPLAPRRAEEALAKRCPEFRPHHATPGVCDGCGRKLVGRQRVWCSTRCSSRWAVEHYWNLARRAARRRCDWRCTRPGCSAPRGDVEINHVDPRRGRGYGTSCGHHAANLEGLCHAHHLEVTRAQRRAATRGRA